jgi:ATP-dependent DNA helicase RecG
MQLSKTAVQAVVTAQVEGSVTNGRLQEITGEHPKDITDVLRALMRDGLLTQQNQRRWASYRVAEGSAPTDGDSPQNSPQWPSDSPQSLGDSPQSAAEVPPTLAALLPLALPARNKKKLPAAQMRQVISALCKGRWLAAGEIALLVARDAEKLQSRFLTAMVREGVLELRYPDVPNRPDQAYRSIDTTT